MQTDRAFMMCTYAYVHVSTSYCRTPVGKPPDDVIKQLAILRFVASVT